MRDLLTPGLLLALAACGPAAVVPPPGGAAPEGPAAPSPGADAPGRPVDPGAPPPTTGGGGPTDPETDNDPDDVEIRRLGSWTQSPFVRRQRQVIRDQATLERVWQQLGAVGQPAEALPSVDWDSEVVILVAAGEQRSGGHEITVGRVAEGSDGFLVEVVTADPGRNCMTTMNLTQPAELVAVRTEAPGEPRFVERQELRDC